jgi:SAM-dependent methyltransferase
MKEQNEDWFATWFDTNYYHTLYQNRDYKEAAFFISNLMKHLDLPTASQILDLACGKGRHSLQLSEMGYDVMGVDLSPNSISLAKKLIENRTNLAFDVLDMRETMPNVQFDAILNLFTSFGYFDDYTDNLKVLNSIAAMLKPGGTFLIDFMNPTKVQNNLVETESKTLDGVTFNLSRSVIEGKIVKNIQFTDHGKEHSYYEKVQAITLSDFEQLIAQTDLQIEATFGNYGLEAFNENDSDRLILLGSKKR